MKKLKRLGLFLVFFSLLIPLPALDLWRHPESAEKNALFVDVGFSSLSFSEGVLFGLPLEIRFDYLLPVPLPVSAGAFFKTPYPNLKSFGARVGYHLDIRDPKTDLYAVYVFDFGFIRNDLLKEYGDEEQPVHYYDFRIGVRRLFGSFFCAAVETDFKIFGLLLMLSIKIH
jgi:hypothetical protein